MSTWSIARAVEPSLRYALALTSKMVAQTAESGVEGSGSWRIFLVGLLIVAPLYLFLTFFVRIVREAYGFVEPPPDAGPPIRVCFGCDNSILDPSYVHCPYCGSDLPPVPEVADGERPGADAAAVEVGDADRSGAAGNAAS